jgi:hypothetical protein
MRLVNLILRAEGIVPVLPQSTAKSPILCAGHRAPTSIPATPFLLRPNRALQRVPGELTHPLHLLSPIFASWFVIPPLMPTSCRRSSPPVVPRRPLGDGATIFSSATPRRVVCTILRVLGRLLSPAHAGPSRGDHLPGTRTAPPRVEHFVCVHACFASSASSSASGPHPSVVRANPHSGEKYLLRSRSGLSCSKAPATFQNLTRGPCFGLFC